MKIRSNQNAGSPAPVESETNIQDGTSNTIMFSESSKPATPFAQDSFETSASKMHPLPGAISNSSEACDAASKDLSYLLNSAPPKHASKDNSVIENVNVKYTFMDYTDDGD